MSYRSDLIGHLHMHPHHAGFYKAGHDFVLVGTQAIRREHERWHAERRTFNTHRHPPGLEVPGEERYMSKGNKALDLKVTVTGDDPDATLAEMLGFQPRSLVLVRPGYSRSLSVVSVERADGNAIGLEAEFEAWWADSHCEGDDEETDAKTWAREAFLWGVRQGKKRSIEKK